MLIILSLLISISYSYEINLYQVRSSTQILAYAIPSTIGNSEVNLWFDTGSSWMWVDTCNKNYSNYWKTNKCP